MTETARNRLIEPHRNLETFTLIWCDADVDRTKENQHTQSTLRSTINYLKVFDNIDISEEYIKQNPDNKIVLIVSGKMGEQLVPHIHDLKQIHTIYVYCTNNAYHEIWAKNFPKIASVVVTMKDLIKYISDDHIHRREIDEAEMKCSIFNPATSQQQESNASFIWFRLLIENIMRLTEGPSIPELIQIATQQYDGNEKEIAMIDDFSSTYCAAKSLYWYTRESFLYRWLNKCLRETDIDMIVYFRSIIRDISQQLALEKSFDEPKITVYRGQLLGKHEFNSIRSSELSYVVMKSFLSTSKNRVKALEFAKQTPPSDILEVLMLEIEVDTKLRQIKPFADISYLSDFKEEEEILFSLGCLFKVKEVVRDVNENVWIMKLILCGDDDSNVMKDVYDDLKNRIHENVDLNSFADFLRDMYVGFENETKYRHLHEIFSLQNDDDEDPDVMLFLGEGYDEAIAFYQKSIDKYMNSSSNINYAHIINIHFEIAKQHAYKVENADVGVDYLEKIIQDLQSKINDCTPLKRANIYLNIGQFYSTYLKKYEKALEYYEKCLDIRRKLLPDDNELITEVESTITSTYTVMKNLDHRLALKQKKLKEQTLDPKELAYLYDEVGDILFSMEKLDVSLESYKKALAIRKDILPWYHPLIIKSYSNITVIYEAMKHYDSMIKYSNIKLDILKKTLPPHHFDIHYLEERIQFIKDLLEPPKKNPRELAVAAFYDSDFDQAIIYYQQIIDEELKSPIINYSNILDIHYEISQVYAKKDGNQLSAINYLEKLIENDFSDGTLQSATIYGKIAGIYHQLRNYEEALKNYEKCLEIQTKLLPIDDRTIYYTEFDVESVHLAKIDYEQMIEFRKKRLEMEFNKQSNRSLNYIAEVYQRIGFIYQGYTTKFDLALENYKAALDFQKQILAKKYSIDTVVTINEIEKSIKQMEEWLAEKE
ncbi:unnamed protein product [Rotaria sordida]|uniref:ADP ribosyltransferase domain-containing protein n=1 Tax=Rotaria sordida TaxID=392033 RepID=A0A815EMJ4_9BILA|nr:unnamed protein product [Rotaria sordida]